MSNSTTTNPIFIDTVQSTAMSGKFHIRAIAWVSTETAGDDIAANDDVKILDGDDNIVFWKRASAAGDDAFLSFGGPYGLIVNGLYVSTMDGGNVFIYLD